MSDGRPNPLVPQEVDCRDLDGFMLNVERLLASELWALSDGDEFKAAVGLWARSWKQVPAASLPNDERILASFAGMPPARFRKVREMAMRGFVECSDGRLYHRVLATEAIRAWGRKNAYQVKREADRKRLTEWREKRTTQRDGNDDETQAETANETRFVAEDTVRDDTVQDSQERIDRTQESKNGSAVAQSARRAPAETISPDWHPDDAQRAYAVRMGLAEPTIGREATKFAGYWATGKRAGTRKTPRGWAQSWLNWVGNAVERNPSAGGAQGLPYVRPLGNGG